MSPIGPILALLTAHRPTENGKRKTIEPMNAIQNLLAQVDHAGITLTPGMAEGVERGHPRMIAYVANLVALRGKRPAIEPREDGGPLEKDK